MKGQYTGQQGSLIEVQLGPRPLVRDMCCAAGAQQAQFFVMDHGRAHLGGRPSRQLVHKRVDGLGGGGVKMWWIEERWE